MREHDFERFADANYRKLHATAYAICGGEAEDAADLLQNTLVKVGVKWRTVSRAENQVAFARKLMLRLYLDEERKLQRRRTGVTVQPEVVDDDPLSRLHDLFELRQYLAELSRTQRAVIVLRYWFDLDFAAIGEELSLSTSSVRASHSRALGKIRNHELFKP